MLVRAPTVSFSWCELSHPSTAFHFNANTVDWISITSHLDHSASTSKSFPPPGSLPWTVHSGARVSFPEHFIPCRSFLSSLGLEWFTVCASSPLPGWKSFKSLHPRLLHICSPTGLCPSQMLSNYISAWEMLQSKTLKEQEWGPVVMGVRKISEEGLLCERHHRREATGRPAHRFWVLPGEELHWAAGGRPWRWTAPSTVQFSVVSLNRVHLYCYTELDANKQRPLISNVVLPHALPASNISHLFKS